MDRKVTLLLKDALWLLDMAPSFASCNDKPTLLRVCAAIEKEYSAELQDESQYPEIPSYPMKEYHKKVKFRLKGNSATMGYNKVGAIKIVREITGLGLKEAKDVVETGSWTTAYLDVNQLWGTYQMDFNAYGYEVTVTNA